MLLLTVLLMAMTMMTMIMLVCRRVIYLFGCASGIAFAAAAELRGVQAGPIKIILRWKEMEPNERPPNENGKQMNVF